MPFLGFWDFWVLGSKTHAPQGGGGYDPHVGLAGGVARGAVGSGGADLCEGHRLPRAGGARRPVVHVRQHHAVCVHNVNVKLGQDDRAKMS